MNELILIFTFSLVVALSGAIVPGPLLTYTIVKTLDTRHRGFLVGVWVIGGHALLESVLIVGILLGFSTFLKNSVVIKIIGILGGSFLLYMGLSIIVDIIKKRVKFALGEKGQSANGSSSSALKVSNPVIGGVLISMSNPYWWIWWATVGFGFMLQYRISFINWQGLLSFLIGHEMGDLLWYVMISTLVFMGRHRINERIYKGILIGCSAVIIGFGFFLGISAFIQ
jgi:threonine/homoserine/homoserine lactone efflux protein